MRWLLTFCGGGFSDQQWLVHLSLRLVDVNAKLRILMMVTELVFIVIQTSSNVCSRTYAKSVAKVEVSEIAMEEEISCW